MTDSATYLAKAEAALALVKTETDLMAWHEEYANSFEYLNMTDTDARTLEALYQRKAGWFMGVMAG